MQLYKCKCINKQYQIQNILIIAKSENELLQINKNIISYKKYKSKLTNPTKNFTLPFFKNLYQLLSNQYELIEALKISLNFFEDERNLIINYIIANIRQGYSFSKTLGLFNQYFDSIVIETIRISEKTAELTHALRNIINYLESQLNIKSRINNTIRYPILVLTLILCIVNIWLIWIIPQFSGIFTDLNIQAPLVTKCILTCSSIIINYKYIILLLVIISTVYCIVFLDKIKGTILKLPIINNIVKNIHKMKFFESLSIMLKSKLNLVDSLECLNTIPEFQKYANIVQFIKSGKTLYEASSLNQQFSNYELAIILTGEQSGQPWIVFQSISNILQFKLNEQFNRIASMLPSILMSIAGVILILLAYSTFAPLYSVFPYS